MQGLLLPVRIAERGRSCLLPPQYRCPPFGAIDWFNKAFFSQKCACPRCPVADLCSCAAAVQSASSGIAKIQLGTDSAFNVTIRHGAWSGAQDAHYCMSEILSRGKLCRIAQGSHAFA